MFSRREVIKETKKYVRNKSGKESTGHDFWHAFRVWQTSKYIARKEGGDLFTIELAALLHDISDWKFNKGSSGPGLKLAMNWLKKLKVEENIIKQVCEIMGSISFKGARVKSKMKTIEGKIVQDADRLDALGAIGIAKVFATGSSWKRLIYNPEISIKKRVRDFRRKDSHSSIHHFYDKPLLLKNLMNTKTGKRLAGERHEFLKKYLKQFFKEWNLK